MQYSPSILIGEEQYPVCLYGNKKLTWGVIIQFEMKRSFIQFGFREKRKQPFFITNQEPRVL